MIVHVIEELRYTVVLPDGTTDPLNTAEDAIVNAADRDDKYTPVVISRDAYIGESE